MVALEAPVRRSGGSSHAKLTTGTRAPRAERRQQATPQILAHFTRPREPARAGQLTENQRKTANRRPETGGHQRSRERAVRRLGPPDDAGEVLAGQADGCSAPRAATASLGRLDVGWSTRSPTLGPRRGRAQTHGFRPPTRHRARAEPHPSARLERRERRASRRPLHDADSTEVRASDGRRGLVGRAPPAAGPHRSIGLAALRDMAGRAGALGCRRNPASRGPLRVPNRVPKSADSRDLSTGQRS